MDLNFRMNIYIYMYILLLKCKFESVDHTVRAICRRFCSWNCGGL